MSPMQRIVRNLSLILTPLVLLATVMVGFGPGSVGASSHREAPLIAADPTVDGTDTYAFISPDAPTTVTLIANWIPFEEPGGGPNFYHYDDNASYYIKIDSDGNAVEDVTYKWTFHTVIKDSGTFLYNTGPIAGPSSTKFNYTQYYTVTQKLGAAPETLLFGNKLMVPDNVGPRSTPNYAALAAQFVNSAGGIKEFTGQRDDPFFVDVNSIFDLGGLRPFNSLHLIPQPTSAGLNSTAGYNVHTTAIQVPRSTLAPTCPVGTASSDKKCVIGVWSTAERPSVITRSQDASGAVSSTGSGTPVQVSRLGNPLVNEVVLPLALKDAFNAIPPSLDAVLFTATPPNPLAGAGAILRTSILTPELANLIPVLYPAVTQKVPTPRQDLFTVFLTGIPGVTQQQLSATVPSEQLRLNVAIPPSANGVCAGNRLGALAGDLAGFPNGRRLEDDVTDIAIRAVAGGYGDILGGPAPGGAGLLGLPNYSPNNTLGDGVDKDDVKCLTGFPYVGTPHAGYNRIHAAIYTSNLPASFYRVGQTLYKRPLR
ncbi:MAG: DUF4331 domain-containing protein [Roseiflexaceae bacterium]